MNKECAIPFNLTETINGRKEYEACALDGSGRAFCSTNTGSWSKPKLNSSDWNVNDEWGYCSDSCPIQERSQGKKAECY